MKIRFYGTRGSIAVPDKDFVQVGGNTSCILVTFGSGRIAILDAGTGIRTLGNELVASAFEQYDNILIALSHTHWDHIQGFPFFKPAYDPRRHFTIAICGKGGHVSNLEGIFAAQMQRQFFPVPIEEMGARLSFWQPEKSSYDELPGVRVIVARHRHPGTAYGYRFEEDGRSLVYCTDVEHGDIIDPEVVSFARGADLLIHDAQYTTGELAAKEGWGHSSWEQAVAVAREAGVRQLALYHHDPEHTDTFLQEIETAARGRFPGSFLAREGLEVEV